ncbi:hypothetical protein ILYODFUR_022934 [Ilyodon furcidens]|uniref:Uncharacterized protein n=1 Tax=Ilyodon furcidens TaxID=33524 RepID=A0ABV0UXB1_9TELE
MVLRGEGTAKLPALQRRLMPRVLLVLSPPPGRGLLPLMMGQQLASPSSPQSSSTYPHIPLYSSAQQHQWKLEFCEEASPEG